MNETDYVVRHQPNQYIEVTEKPGQTGWLFVDLRQAEAVAQAVRLFADAHRHPDPPKSTE